MRSKPRRRAELSFVHRKPPSDPSHYGRLAITREMASSPFLEPGRDIGRMVGTRTRRDSKIREDHACSCLGHDLLHGVGFRTEAARQITVEPVLRGRRMNALMKQDAVVCRRVPESAELGHMDP